MIVYFADRELNVLGTASTNLPGGIAIIDDLKHEDIETGVRTFEVTFVYDQDSHDLIMDVVTVGNFLLRSSGDENEFYTIITTEQNTLERTVHAYCEDAGLDMLNYIVDAESFALSHDAYYYVNYYLRAGWSIGIDELSDGSTLKLSWDGESTVTERLLSIVNSFGGELDFSYEIDRLQVVKRHVNLYQHRGNSTALYQLRLGRDIAKITTHKSIENLATAFRCSGATLEGQSTPINFYGASFSSDGTTTHSPADPDDDYQIQGIEQVICKSAMEKWSSKLDNDGWIVRSYQYETTNQRTLFSHAVAELRKVIDEEITYELEFIRFPDDIRLGDRVHVVDDQDNLYLEGRVLAIEKSVTEKTTSATLGEWVVQSSGIVERLAALADEVKKKALSATSVSIASSNGTIFNNAQILTTLTATVYYADEAITTQTRLEEIFGSDVLVKWYNNGTLVGTGFTYSVNSNNQNESYIVKVED